MFSIHPKKYRGYTFRFICLFENDLKLILQRLRNTEQLRKESKYKVSCGNRCVGSKDAHTEVPICRILQNKLKSEAYIVTACYVTSYSARIRHGIS